MKTQNDLIISRGGLGERNYGEQYRMGNRVYDADGIACCLCAQPVGNAGGYTCLYLVKEEPYIEQNTYRIRKLTETECWRLMGFTDEDIQKAKDAGLSKTQLYKQAGNSIVVDVLYHIFRKLYDAMPYLFDDLKVGSYFSGIGAFESALDRLFDGLSTETITEIESLSASEYDANCPSAVGGGQVVYDDYNSRIRQDQETIGTVTTNCGGSSIRSWYKLIEQQNKSNKV